MVWVYLAADYDAQAQSQTFPFGQYFTWAQMGPLGSPMGFVDVSGDGQADFWGWRADGDIEIRLSNGDGTFGAPELLSWVNDSDRRHPIGWADINGDGLMDFWGWAVVSGKGYTAGHLYTRLSLGTGAFAPTERLPWAHPFVDVGLVGFADLNGDGKADWYGWTGNTDPITYHLTQADGTLSPTARSFGWTGSGPQAGPIGFADITGDGLAEFYGWSNAGWQGQVQILGALEAKPDLLTTVTNGLGGVWRLTYRTTGEPALSGTQTQLPIALPVVETITVEDGTGNQGTTSYAQNGRVLSCGGARLSGISYEPDARAARSPSRRDCRPDRHRDVVSSR